MGYLSLHISISNRIKLVYAGAILFFVLLGLSGCFITCFDHGVRGDLSQPCQELCLCCCQPRLSPFQDIYFLLILLLHICFYANLSRDICSCYEEALKSTKEEAWLWLVQGNPKTKSILMSFQDS